MNNYTLHIANNPIVIPYHFLQSAILAGQAHNVPFTVNLISPEMVACYWQPDMGEVAYNRYYEDYMLDCQRSLQGVMG